MPELVLTCAFLGIVFALAGAIVILSIAIDAGRLVRRANDIIRLLQQHEAHLASINDYLKTLTSTVHRQLLAQCL